MQEPMPEVPVKVAFPMRPILSPPFRPCAGGAVTVWLLNAAPLFLLLRLAAGQTEEVGGVRLESWVAVQSCTHWDKPQW
jgi:hypothetical protein